MKRNAYRCWCRRWISRLQWSSPPSAVLCVSPANRIEISFQFRFQEATAIQLVCDTRPFFHFRFAIGSVLGPKVYPNTRHPPFSSPFSAWPANQSWPCRPARWSKVLAIPDSIPWWIAAPVVPAACRTTGERTGKGGQKLLKSTLKEIAPDGKVLPVPLWDERRPGTRWFHRHLWAVGGCAWWAARGLRATHSRCQVSSDAWSGPGHSSICK